jgi:hypothetical protein
MSRQFSKLMFGALPVVRCLHVGSLEMLLHQLTKYAHFCALSHPFKASTISTAFMETVQNLHGNPKIIVSDRDPIFTGHF